MPTLISSIFICIFLLDSSFSLHVSGEWRSEEQFFKFLAKFGFQKTNLHDRKISEGYIFGNITLNDFSPRRNVVNLPFTYLSNNSYVNVNSIYNNIDEEAIATLTLLPRKFFVNFYRNRTVASKSDLSSEAAADLACQYMFQELQKEAYDARCHDTGREDFLRRVPCIQNSYCADEDNPSNVIKNSQLTYAVQDINNPRFWYLSFVACMRNSTCGWQHTKSHFTLSYNLTLVNGRPVASNTNIFKYHFSFEKQDTLEIYLICIIIYGIILVPLQIYASCRQDHPVTRLFLAVLTVQLFGLFLDTLHLFIFSYNGIGSEGLNIMGDLLNIAAQSLFVMLLLLLAKGWAITRMQLSGIVLLFLLWGIYSLFMLILYFWNMMEVDIIEDIDEYQTWPGWLIIFLRVIIMLWFLYELRKTMTYEHNVNKLQFFVQFGAASLVWLVYLPCVALIALQISPLWRYKLLLGFTYLADLIAHSFMTYMLWPERSEQYLLLANELDLADELDEFNEAPHIVNDLDVELITSNEVSPMKNIMT